jgi:hypothetical protein
MFERQRLPSVLLVDPFSCLTGWQHQGGSRGLSWPCL